MLIVQVEPPHVTQGGDWFYRTHSPGLMMAEHDGVHVVDLTNVHRKRDDLLSRADVLVLNMVCDPDLLPVIEQRKGRGQVTVYEVNDDVSCMQPWNPAAAFYANPDHQILFRMLIRACDGAQFCTPELERIYGRLAPCRAVFPNQIARCGAGPNPDREGRVVIGWGGSVGHLGDIARVAEPLSAWVGARDDVVLHLMCADKIWALFDGLSSDKKRHFAVGDIDAYHAFVAGLHIGLAPLEDTGFNRCRSDVKFLEYAVHGVVPVVQALVPYERTVVQGETGWLFHDPAEMRAILDELVHDRQLLGRVSQRARDYVACERSERAHAEKRTAFYRSLGATDGEGEAAWFAELAKAKGAEGSGRHLALGSTRYELLVYQALVIGQMHAQRREAAQLLREAARLEPSAYQPHLFGASMASDPVDWLRAAIARNQKSLSAHVALGQHFAGSGQADEAVKSLLAAAEAYPGYDVAYLRLAELLESCNQSAQAREFYEAAENLRQPLVALVAVAG